MYEEIHVCLQKYHHYKGNRRTSVRWVSEGRCTELFLSDVGDAWMCSEQVQRKRARERQQQRLLFKCLHHIVTLASELLVVLLVHHMFSSAVGVSITGV